MTKKLKKVIENWQNYPEIVEAKITDDILRPVECSGDRSGYLIYQSKTSKIDYEKVSTYWV